MIRLGKRVVVTAGASLLAVGCTTLATPWNAEVDRIEVGRFRSVEPIDVYITGGGGVMVAAGGFFTLEPVDRPGELVNFTGSLRECPADPPGDTLYLVHLTWSDRNNSDRGLWMTACTPIDREKSFGF